MSIQEQIEALTQELRPYPKIGEWVWQLNDLGKISTYQWEDSFYNKAQWAHSLFSSTEGRVEVEEYADCYRRLKLYRLIGKKKEKAACVRWDDNRGTYRIKYGTDFSVEDEKDMYARKTYGEVTAHNERLCVLGGVWFDQNTDRLEALKICGITREFQEKCSKFGLGGA